MISTAIYKMLWQPKVARKIGCLCAQISCYKFVYCDKFRFFRKKYCNFSLLRNLIGVKG